jgi:hypothetical protein
MLHKDEAENCPKCGSNWLLIDKAQQNGSGLGALFRQLIKEKRLL